MATEADYDDAEEELSVVQREAVVRETGERLRSRLSGMLRTVDARKRNAAMDLSTRSPLRYSLLERRRERTERQRREDEEAPAAGVRFAGAPGAGGGEAAPREGGGAAGGGAARAGSASGAGAVAGAPGAASPGLDVEGGAGAGERAEEALQHEVTAPLHESESEEEGWKAEEAKAEQEGVDGESEGEEVHRKARRMSMTTVPADVMAVLRRPEHAKRIAGLRRKLEALMRRHLGRFAENVRFDLGTVEENIRRVMSRGDGDFGASGAASSSAASVSPRPSTADSTMSSPSVGGEGQGQGQGAGPGGHGTSLLLPMSVLLRYVGWRMEPRYDRRKFLSHLLLPVSQAVCVEAFWFAHVSLFQPHNDWLREAILQRLAHRWPELDAAVQTNSDLFFQHLPFAAADAALATYFFLVPGSRSLYTPAFRLELFTVVVRLLAGMEMTPLAVATVAEQLFPDERPLPAVRPGTAALIARDLVGRRALADALGIALDKDGSPAPTMADGAVWARRAAEKAGVGGTSGATSRHSVRRGAGSFVDKGAAGTVGRGRLPSNARDPVRLLDRHTGGLGPSSSASSGLGAGAATAAGSVRTDASGDPSDGDDADDAEPRDQGEEDGFDGDDALSDSGLRLTGAGGAGGAVSASGGANNGHAHHAHSAANTSSSSTHRRTRTVREVAAPQMDFPARTTSRRDRYVLGYADTARVEALREIRRDLCLPSAVIEAARLLASTQMIKQQTQQQTQQPPHQRRSASPTSPSSSVPRALASATSAPLLSSAASAPSLAAVEEAVMKAVALRARRRPVESSFVMTQTGPLVQRLREEVQRSVRLDASKLGGGGEGGGRRHTSKSELRLKALQQSSQRAPSQSIRSSLHESSATARGVIRRLIPVPWGKTGGIDTFEATRTAERAVAEAEAIQATVKAIAADVVQGSALRQAALRQAADVVAKDVRAGLVAGVGKHARDIQEEKKHSAAELLRRREEQRARGALLSAAAAAGVTTVLTDSQQPGSADPSSSSSSAAAVAMVSAPHSVLPVIPQHSASGGPVDVHHALTADPRFAVFAPVGAFDPDPHEVLPAGARRARNRRKRLDEEDADAVRPARATDVETEAMRAAVETRAHHFRRRQAGGAASLVGGAKPPPMTADAPVDPAQADAQAATNASSGAAAGAGATGGAGGASATAHKRAEPEADGQDDSDGAADDAEPAAGDHMKQHLRSVPEPSALLPYHDAPLRRVRALDKPWTIEYGHLKRVERRDKDQELLEEIERDVLNATRAANNLLDGASLRN